MKFFSLIIITTIFFSGQVKAQATKNYWTIEFINKKIDSVKNLYGVSSNFILFLKNNSMVERSIDSITVLTNYRFNKKGLTFLQCITGGLAVGTLTGFALASDVPDCSGWFCFDDLSRTMDEIGGAVIGLAAGTIAGVLITHDLKGNKIYSFNGLTEKQKKHILMKLSIVQ